MGPFGSASALLVDDNVGADMTGTIGGAPSGTCHRDGVELCLG